MALLATSITDRLAALVATCKGASYPSLVGTTVLVGQIKGVEQQAPCCFVIPERVTAEGRYAQHQITREYRLCAFARLSSHPTLSEHALIDQIIRDLRQVVEKRDGGTGGLVSLGAEISFQGAQPGYHEDGGQLVGAALTYRLTYPQAAPA